MATKSFSFNTAPHVTTVNGRDLLFEPEAMGDEFMDAFTELKEAQAAASGIDLSTLDPAKLRGAAPGLRQFVACLMLTESAQQFLAMEIVKEGEVLSTHANWDEAETVAEQHGGAHTKWAMPIPDRILVALMEWVTELYGGGANPRPTGPSDGSAKASPRVGLTDSGTGALSAAQLAAGWRGDESYDRSRSFHRFHNTVRELTGYTHILPVHQGRPAERLLASTLLGPGKIFLSKSHFDTLRANVALSGGEAWDLPCPEARDLDSTEPFKGTSTPHV